jgi:hypothetical protein
MTDTRILKECGTCRLYEKGGEFFISQKKNGMFRRFKVLEADVAYFSKVMNLERMLNTVLDIVRDRNDPDYYQTKTGE